MDAFEATTGYSAGALRATIIAVILAMLFGWGLFCYLKTRKVPLSLISSVIGFLLFVGITSWL